MLAVAQMIDHAWAVALDRAQKAGILLAHILMSGAHGDRPVTLIGYSMGARLIFHCLLELCRHSAKGAVPFPNNYRHVRRICTLWLPDVYDGRCLHELLRCEPGMMKSAGCCNQGCTMALGDLDSMP